MSISAHGLQLQRGRRRLLDNVSLDVHCGEFLVIIGPNGAGKSTLLKALCGDMACDAGDVIMGQRLLDDWPAVERARVRAILPQHSQLAFAFTVHEVVAMGRTPHHHESSAHENEVAIHKAMALADVTHLEERFYSTLSGGEAQRVQFARVLAQLMTGRASDHYLFLDEPTASLDPAHQHATLKVARSLCKQNIAVVAVLHDLNLAAMYADRIAVMKDGRLTMSGSPWEVLTENVVSRVFDIPVHILKHPVLDRPLVVQDSLQLHV